MPLTVGKHDVVIQYHTITTIGDKEALRLTCYLDDGDETDVLIWLTEKSMGIARRSLTLCGFDVDTESLDTLIQSPERLKGRRITVLAEEYKGRLRAAILLNPEPSKKRIHEIQDGLRNARSNDAEEDLPF